MRRCLAIIFSAVLLAGCGFMPKVPELPDSKTLPPAANLALKSIVSARGVLDAAYDFIGTGVRTGAIEPTQGRAWFNELDTYRDKIKKAQEIYDAGGFDAAKLQAQGTEALIKFIHDQALEALRKKAQGTAFLIPLEDCPCLVPLKWASPLRIAFQPAKEMTWTRQPQN